MTHAETNPAAQADVEQLRQRIRNCEPGRMVFFSGSHLAIVNRTPTPRDAHADLCLAANVGEVFNF